jgi:hypothetical protein
MNIFSVEPNNNNNKLLFNYYTFVLLQIYLYHFKKYFSFYCHFFIYLYIFFFEELNIHLFIIYYFYSLRKKFINILYYIKKYLGFKIKRFNSKLSDEEIDYNSELIYDSDLLILKSQFKKKKYIKQL